MGHTQGVQNLLRSVDGGELNDAQHELFSHKTHR
jgi:hypothetical protein